MAELLEVLVELDTAPFKSDNDARSTELEQADLVSFFDLMARCAEGFVNPKSKKVGC